MSENAKLKVAVVGTGSLGQHHARVYAEHPETDLVAVVDTDPKNGRAVAERHGVPYLESIDELGEISAASVVVPTAHHYAIASKLFARGIHCLVEKPIAINSEQGKALCREAAENGVVLQVGHIERFNPAVVALADVLTTPIFIESHRLGPPTPRVKDVGVVLDLMIHDLDLILSLVGSDVESLDAVGVPVLTEREDIANARLRFASGCVANVTASRITPAQQRKIRFFQSDAYLSLDYLNRKLDCYRKFAQESGPPRIEHQEVEIAERESLEAELSSFLEAVRGEHPPVVSGEDGVRALQLAEEITETIADQVK